jgi:hypothetical protein
MKIFQNANIACDWECPICHKNINKPVALIRIFGTQDGNNIEAKQIHVDCIELTMLNIVDSTLLIQQFK